MAKAILLEMGASCGGEPPIEFSEAAKLEDEETIFTFGVISTMKIFENIWKKVEAFVILRKLKSFVNFERKIYS